MLNESIGLTDDRPTGQAVADHTPSEGGLRDVEIITQGLTDTAPGSEGL